MLFCLLQRNYYCRLATQLTSTDQNPKTRKNAQKKPAKKCKAQKTRKTRAKDPQKSAIFCAKRRKIKLHFKIANYLLFARVDLLLLRIQIFSQLANHASTALPAAGMLACQHGISRAAVTLLGCSKAVANNFCCSRSCLSTGCCVAICFCYAPVVCALNTESIAKLCGFRSFGFCSTSTRICCDSQ